MKTTFKMFLCEGGKATEQWGTERATANDIRDAITFVSKTLDIPEDELEDCLLGSTHVTLKGKKDTSGDIDLAIEATAKDIDTYRKKMFKATHGQEYWNNANRIASYAVPTKTNRVQVDLMFVNNKTWSKFAYHSSEGDKSVYSGTVRNLLMVSVAQTRLEKDKDFVLKDDDDNLIARASRSFKLDTGLERLFKLAPMRKDGKGRTKSAAKVSPEQLMKEIEKIAPGTKFEPKADPIKDPAKVTEMLFGKGVEPKDVMTAEQVLKLVKSNRFTDAERKQIFDQCKKHFENVDEKVPPEFK